MNDPYEDYVIEFIRKRMNSPIQVEDLSPEAKVLMRRAAALYKKMYGINQMISQMASKRKKSFSFQRSKLKMEEESLRKEYMDIEREYNRILEDIVEKLNRTEKIEKRETTIVADFSFLKDIIGQKGVILEPLKCPVCGAPLDLPDEGNILICPYCGTKIKAVDVFDKIKSILGEIGED